MRTVIGRAKLFDEDSSYVCDARYQVKVGEYLEGRMRNTGYLSDIEYVTLLELPGRALTLELEDGTTWEIAVVGLNGLPPDRCEIVVSTEIGGA